MPKVSIVIPVFNVENYLKECLDSLVNQTFKDIEIICVDDGSTDDSFNILVEYAERDKRIVILQQENQGAACARNYGMSLAQGEYLIFLDSDDIFHLELLEKAVKKAEIFNADVTVFKAESFDTNTGNKAVMNDNISNFYYLNDKSFSCVDIPEDIFNSFLVPAWNKLVRRDFIKENAILFQNVKRCNDLLFTSKVLVMASKIILVDEVLLYYRVGMHSNLQAGNDKTPLEFYQALRELKIFLDENKLYSVVENSFLKLAIDNIFYNLNTLKSSASRDLLIDKFRKEGFRFLGIEQSKKLRKITYTGFLQYKFICRYKGLMISKILYKIHKLWEYYKLTGLNNTLKKILLKF